MTLRRVAVPLALVLAAGGAYATRRRWAPELASRWRALSPRAPLPLRDAPAPLERTWREPPSDSDRRPYSTYRGHGYVQEYHGWYYPGWYAAPQAHPAPPPPSPGPGASVTVEEPPPEPAPRPFVDPPRLPPGRLPLLERPERGRPKHALEGGAP